MKATLGWMSIGYAAEFAVPLFDLVTNAPELQQRIYTGVRALYPYALRTADMHVSPSGLQSETGIRITMFGGNASVALTPVRAALDFYNVSVSKDDFDICKQCIDLISEALNKSCADVVIQSETITSSLRLEAAGDPAGHLSKIAASNVRLNPSEFGATEEHPIVSIEIGNSGQRWKSSANVTVSAAAFIVFCQSRYDDRRSSVGDRIDAQLSLLDGILTRIQVEAETKHDDSAARMGG